jgi:hypothetical protein
MWYHPNPVRHYFFAHLFYFLTIFYQLSAEFEGFLNGLEDSIDRAITSFQEALYSRKVLIDHFDPRRAQIACHSILRMTEKGSTAMSMVCDIPKFWVNLEALEQTSDLNSIESTITRVFCMQGALKFHYWLLDIIPSAIKRTSKPSHKPKTWIDKLITDVRSSIAKGGHVTFHSSEYLPNLMIPEKYEMSPQLFHFDDTDQLTSLISSILRRWLRFKFPSDLDYLAQLTLLDIVTTYLPPSILFLDKIWEMYKTPFSTIFNNNWVIRRSKTKLNKGLANFENKFALHPFAVTGSSSRGKLQSLSNLIYQWMQFTGVDPNTAEIVSESYNH